MAQEYSPTEIFKRATAATLRAIAERDDVTVGFGPEAAGVAANLEAMLEEQYRRQGFERITERTDSTMAEAVRLLTREALTKQRPPPAARRVVDLWRPWLEGRIGKDFGELDRTILDQDAYARATRRLLQDLDLDLGDVDDQADSEEQQGG